MLPLLNNRIINAIFHLLGNILHWKDLLNSKDNGLTAINILLLIISGPTALLGFKIFRTSITSYSLTTIVVKVLQSLSSKSGRSIPSSSKSVYRTKIFILYLTFLDAFIGQITGNYIIRISERVYVISSLLNNILIVL